MSTSSFMLTLIKYMKKVLVLKRVIDYFRGLKKEGS